MPTMKQFIFLLLACCCSFLISLTSWTITSAAPSTPSTAQSIHVIGRMSVTLNAQERTEYNRLTQTLFKETLRLDHPPLYTCNEDINSPGTFVWDEIWESKDALDKHLASNHFKAWWSWVEPHLAGSLQVLYVDQAALKKV
jgi:quinol monooxygenase YgiN